MRKNEEVKLNEKFAVNFFSFSTLIPLNFMKETPHYFMFIENSMKIIQVSRFLYSLLSIILLIHLMSNGPNENYSTFLGDDLFLCSIFFL